MNTGFCSSVTPHPQGECATHPLAHPDGRLALSLRAIHPPGRTIGRVQLPFLG